MTKETDQDSRSDQSEIDELARAVDNYESTCENMFLDALSAEDETIRWYGAKGVGLKGVQNAAPKLVELLGQPAQDLGKSDVRRISAWALATLGFDSIEPFLDGVLDSGNELLREGMADSLGIAGDIRALPYLIDLFDSRSDQTASWAALGLSKLGPSVVDPIGDLLANQDSLRRCGYLLDALQKIGTAGANEEIDSFLAAQTPDIAIGLGKMIRP